MSQADVSTPAPVPVPPATSGSEVDSTSSGMPPGEAGVARPSGRTWTIVIAGGLLAGLGGFGCGEYARWLFAPSLELPPAFRNQERGPAEVARRLRVSEHQIATATSGALWALLGLALGAAGGLARRSATAAIRAALVGLILAAAAGATASYLLVPWYRATSAPPSDDNATREFCRSLATHGGIWMAAGAAAGLALGLGLGGGRVPQAMIGGILAAALAAVIYQLGAEVLFPQDKTLEPIATAPGPRLLAHLAVALCVAAGTLWAADYLSLHHSSPKAQSRMV